jgi:hypothetical protein
MELKVGDSDAQRLYKAMELSLPSDGKARVRFTDENDWIKIYAANDKETVIFSFGMDEVISIARQKCNSKYYSGTIVRINKFITDFLYVNKTEIDSEKNFYKNPAYRDEFLAKDIRSRAIEALNIVKSYCPVVKPVEPLPSPPLHNPYQRLLYDALDFPALDDGAGEGATYGTYKGIKQIIMPSRYSHVLLREYPNGQISIEKTEMSTCQKEYTVLKSNGVMFKGTRPFDPATGALGGLSPTPIDPSQKKLAAIMLRRQSEQAFHAISLIL